MRYIDFFVGYIKLFIYKLAYGAKLKFNGFVKVSRNATVRVIGDGKIHLGKGCSLSSNSRVSAVKGAEIYIGQNTGIGYNNLVVSREKILIGDNVMIGPGVCIYDHDHVYKTNDVMRKAGYTTEPVEVGDNVWIGANAVILKGSKIGSNSVIAAGAVVKGNIPDNSLVYRNSELVIKEIDR